MGFGVLFIGYFLEFLLGLNRIGVFTHVIGYMVIFVGLSRLRLYCHKFRYALYMTIPLMLLSAYRTFEGLAELFVLDYPFVTDTATMLVQWADLALVLLFHIFLAIAMMEICNRTGVKKNAIRAMQNMVIVVIYVVLQACLMLLDGTTIATLLYGLSLLLNLLWVICNLVLLGSCYMRICPAGEENSVKEPKPSRFAFVNRLREKYRRSEEKAIREDRAYHQERFDRKMQKNAAKNDKKNKQQPPKPRAAKRAEVQAARDAARRRRDEP
ncbi:MAG: hypothetical protein IJW40_02510 [Clostridia bacterium]|nr:hypothetical protein [Clostridia bacterium]